MAAASDPIANCRCLVEATVRDASVRRDIAIHLLTLRLVKEGGAADIAGHLARKAREGHCGREAGP
jgi:hypothetical protein